MTQVTALERAVIRNIAVAGQAIDVRAIANGPEAVKPNQVNAVLLNLKRKGVVSRPTVQTAVLTASGIALVDSEWSYLERLEAMRNASNKELNRVTHMTIEQLRVTNALITMRNKVWRVLHSLK